MSDDSLDAFCSPRRHSAKEPQAVLRRLKLAKVSVYEPEGIGEVVSPEHHGAIGRSGEQLQRAVDIMPPGKIVDP